ncbi:MotA/TolQ/ExbB proton channel family protein [Burkholderia cepacia]|uniref:MotA/TolQ/ExbB proton channel family protein n=1 Tax=Burkholderia cepacia TaxID=292 RepID=UPI002019F12E|nr:MotA/TolQ/ExbB proton channel family protein [Burkholderia cepacia]UQO39098.1 MotA/TolQ/ExbB proton channel family protein [Burkholderia cepacia]UQO50052.1 MotA/TolQ/ExbB proton channel family protein [Burkholderia cepacia]UQP09180.1 MotA/TolQ/ExbB proton channel family protein [Burkholderia cepacia]
MNKRFRAAVAASLMISAGIGGTLIAPQAVLAQQAAASASQATSGVALTSAAPAASGAADRPVPPPEPATSATVENPYGLGALWANGDFVARFVLGLLVVMSLGSWYVMVTKFIEQARANGRAKSADEQVWNAPTLAEGAAQLDDTSPFRFIAENAIEAGEHHDTALLDSVDRNTWIELNIERSITSVSNRLQDGLAFLGTVGSTAPFVGLFGTVWGIYHALTAIGIAGQASIDKVAGPVGEALIMTAIGLAVAVPAVLGYNFLVRRNKSVMERVRDFGAQLHTVLLAGGRRAAGRIATPAAQTPQALAVQS